MWKCLRLLVLLVSMSQLPACDEDASLSYQTWHCVETSANSGVRQYLVYVYPVNNDTTSYIFSNFHNITTDDTGDIRVKIKSGQISIEAQRIEASLIEGSGQVVSKDHQMIINFVVDNKDSFRAELKR